MSINKQDIFNHLKTFETLASKGNNAAIGVIPNLVHALVKYVEEATGHKADAVLNTAEPIVDTVATNAATKIADDAKAFAVETAAKLLRQNGNVTIETDKGKLSAEIGDGLLPNAEKAGIDVAKEVANAVVQAAEDEGATQITAVTTKVADDVVPAAVEEVVETIEETVAKATTKKAPAKK